MATAVHGSLSEYDPALEPWSIYIERLEQYFLANDILAEPKKRAILLHACGSKVFQLIRNLADDQPTAKSYTEVVALVKNYYDPKPSVIVQRYTFNTRARAPDETIASYVAALRQIAEHCDYKDSLQEMLRDRLVCGVNHAGIQKCLLAEKDLTLEVALSKAQALPLEAAERDTQHIRTTTVSSSVQNSQVHLASHKDTGRPRTETGRQKTRPCFRCGGFHSPATCRCKDWDCNKCKKRGHIAKVCMSAKKQDYKRRSASKNHCISTTDTEEELTYDMFSTGGGEEDAIIINIHLNQVPVEMELDTGASRSVINQNTYQDINAVSQVPIVKSSAKLKTYMGEYIPVLGTIDVIVKYREKEVELSVLVVDGTGPNLLGRDWLSKLSINLGEVFSLVTPSPLAEVLAKYPNVFTEQLGCLKDVKVQLSVDSEASPKFFKPRPVPFILRVKVGKELDRLVAVGVLSPIQFSRWAAPIVPIVKQNGAIRICGDFKVTINQVSRIDTYPLPRIEELFAKLSGGKYFSKLDLSQAYLQLPLDDNSKEYVTINTHKGLFRYNRLPFGVAAAPAIFQRYMDSLLQGFEGVSVYLDDILVSGSTVEDHMHKLSRVLHKLDEVGLHLNKDKCFFLKSSVEYLGHIIDENGLHPTAEKVKAIKEAPKPRNIEELRSFLGIINYYSRFLSNLSTKLAPLYELLHKNRKWSWTTEQDSAFQQAKDALQANSLLVHFDESKPLILTCDASAYGIGVVLSHTMEDGSDRPIAYASRTLTVAEKKYAQLEKEGLAIIFGTKKFHNYLYGRTFTIQSDHKPLFSLFSEAKPVPQMASARIQRWALALSTYSYTIKYRPGKEIANADALSRLPLAQTTSSDRMPGDLLHLLAHLSTTCLDATEIKQHTDKDPILSKVRRYILSGWQIPETTSELQPYITRQNELSVLQGCILWGARVVIPKSCQALVLQELHEVHQGMSKMKSLSRSYVWWPKLNQDIEELVKNCQTCQQLRPSPPTAPLHPWEYPEKPWDRLHIDFAGPFMGHMFLVLIDAYSKWIDVEVMQSITATKTIEKLRTIFAVHGLPRKIVTDNGPTFTSQDFKIFTERNSIKHITTAPYHPSSNGLAERAVRIVKQALKSGEGNSIQEKLSKFLFKYRITPQSSTEVPD